MICFYVVHYIPPASLLSTHQAYFELKLHIFSVRYPYFHFFGWDFAISNTLKKTPCRKYWKDLDLSILVNMSKAPFDQVQIYSKQIQMGVDWNTAM